MAWKIEFDERAGKDLSKLDRLQSRRIITFLYRRLALLEDPRSIGEALKGKRFFGMWKYRVGDYRLIARIHDQKITIVILRVGHRSQVYD
ncbi:type II toxin-antitoxin system RelE family toxin [Rhizobium sp. TRM95796]|uniref:type II toxin-antitoxin system RelE family toxin n=1 Tax=Rhizobium sp. TRM95796 TaxID=2979862 RepID=UPI0021E88329|nr:type II toxin-antitoxin system RelE/ParE family toxin [Rhizobium sp. TRM95796]MCV3765467.1 type II toxin-antitoxin system RelE/ParE family toxin [Rhizobium sp. TRM95796]